MSQYPEHDKLEAVKDDADTIGNFIEWLESQGYTICRWRDAGNNGKSRQIKATEEEITRISLEVGAFAACLARIDGIDNPEFESWGSGFIRNTMRPEVWIARYFDIDEKVLSQEKQQVLNTFLNSQK